MFFMGLLKWLFEVEPQDDVTGFYLSNTPDDQINRLKNENSALRFGFTMAMIGYVVIAFIIALS